MKRLLSGVELCLQWDMKNFILLFRRRFNFFFPKTNHIHFRNNENAMLHVIMSQLVWKEGRGLGPFERNQQPMTTCILFTSLKRTHWMEFNTCWRGVDASGVMLSEHYEHAQNIYRSHLLFPVAIAICLWKVCLFDKARMYTHRLTNKVCPEVFHRRPMFLCIDYSSFLLTKSTHWTEWKNSIFFFLWFIEPLAKV